VTLGLTSSEHPGFSDPHSGEVGARQVVQAIMSNPKVWKKTALFITYDENGGFFDHVAPPTPPRGTKGEFLTVGRLPKAAQGIRGPIGLGFRVPTIVVSPFSRGGLVCAFNVAARPNTSRARLPNVSSGEICPAFTTPVKVPSQPMPKQARGSRRRPSGIVR
jgi:phospholipase C